MRGSCRQLNALHLLDCPPQEAAMVAAHGTDLQAAAALGLRPCFIRRPLEWGPDAEPQEPPVVPVTSVAVTVAPVYPLALAVKVVAPVLVESAVTVTVCGVE